MKKITLHKGRYFLCVENKFNKFVCFDKRERTVPS
nr:MAG TPA: hypothetical protein [Caudoviricetes sp.]